jgi:very-short-patch-repair endonuclease
VGGAEVDMSIERARELRKRMGAPEAKLWNALRSLKPLGLHFRRQVPLGPYYADFACHHPRLVIEVDGDSHAYSEDYDARRNAFMRDEGYEVLRVTNLDVMENVDGVGEAVLLAVASLKKDA